MINVRIPEHPANPESGFVPKTTCPEILTAAADMIERYGLAKWSQLCENGKMCIHGAISVAAFGMAEHYTSGTPAGQAELAVYRFLHGRGEKGVYLGTLTNDANLADWNNEGKRTQAEVVEALRSASCEEPS